MKVSKLNSCLQASMAAAMIVFTLSACNSSDSSGKNSSTTADTMTSTSASMDTSSKMSTTSAQPAKTAKKVGKVSVTMAPVDKSSQMAMDKAGYYNYTEVSPAYKGGQSAIEDYITNNIEYPQDAIDNNIEGTVNVQFGVDENGNISNVKAVGNKLGYGLEDEAVKVVSNMSKWTPGQVKGKNVKTWMIIPITYRLEG